MKTHLSPISRPKTAAWRWPVVAIILLALAGALRPPLAHAATITVAAGEVAVSANDQCSLREALINANNDAATHADCTAGSGADDGESRYSTTSSQCPVHTSAHVGEASQPRT